MSARILVIDDDLALREMMALALGKEGFEVDAAPSLRAARERLRDADFDLLVADIYLGDGSGLEVIDEVRRTRPATRVILVTAHGTVETAAVARRSGAFDYLAKPFAVEELVDRVRAALAHGRPRSAEIAVGPESMIVGNHPSIVEVYKAVARVAPLAIPVLVRGETGTGKELVARALHRFSASPEGPFVAMNCGAIPPDLLESELFGHRRGAFTGAVRDHRGAVEAAREGTLFLDEVGELPLDLQVKLLRFLQSGEVRPVGDDRAVQVPARVVAATHRDLRREAAQGRFREDFYYRLAAYEIEVPPLRRRRSDIPLLVEHFRRTVQNELGLEDAPGPSRESLALLGRQPWPGNVRQLEHLVRRALVDLGTLADAEGLERLLPSTAVDADDGPPAAIGGDLTLEELERLHVARVLARVGFNRTRAAEILGIERKSLYRKAERLGIPLDGREET